jgi:SsrA-binding protein
MAKPPKHPGDKLLAKNRRATFDYELLDRFEAGLVLMGSEVKSMRAGTVELGDAWASVEPDGIYLKNMTVQPLEHGSYQHQPRRARKLLLKAREIEEIRRSIQQAKLTLIPLCLYLKRGLIKAELAMARGRKKGDKRQVIKEREANREAFAARRATKRER